MSIALLLAMLMQSTPAVVHKQGECHKRAARAGGSYLTRTVCPEARRQPASRADSINRMWTNMLVAGKQCPGGIADLRAGGDVDRLSDYVCPAQDSR